MYPQDEKAHTIVRSRITWVAKKKRRRMRSVSQLIEDNRVTATYAIRCVKRVS